MLRILGVVLAAGFALAVPKAAEAAFCPLLVGPTAGTACSSYPSLSAGFDVGVVPKKLPRDRMAPVALNLSATVSTTDGTHPSALRELTIDLDRNIAIDAEGVPVCRLRTSLGRRLGKLRKACRSATVGGGNADLEVAFSEEKPIRESRTLTLYNSGLKGGVVSLYGVASINVPKPQAIVIPIEIKKIDTGGVGLEAVERIPVIAGGNGSLIGLRLRLKRLFSFEGKQKSYTTARCPMGQLRAALTALFKNEAKSPGAPSQTTLQGTVVSPCASKR
jgi:hypothetical protein